MYDKYPEYDVPEHNIIQKFFAQRWSSIIIEIALMLVLTVAAGRALDPFGINDENTETQVVTRPVMHPQQTGSDGISVEAIKAYGINFIRTQQYPEAVAMYDLAVYAEPNQIDNYAWRGYANINSGEYVEAYSDYSTVVKMDEQSFDGHNSLCWTYGELQQFDDALTHCNTAVELAQSDVEQVIAYENRCWVNVEKGDYENAYRDCMKVFEVQPNCSYESCALAHYNIGRVLMEQGKHFTAIEHFNRAYLYGSHYPQMYFDIAAVYEQFGFNAAAIASYEQHIQLAGEDSNPVAQSRISELRGN